MLIIIRSYELYYENENFYELNYGPYNINPIPIYNSFDPYYNPYYNNYTNFPFWNTQIGNKSNMSHDLRGDPIIIPKQYFAWNNSNKYPIYNRPLFM